MADPIYLKNPDTGLVHLYTSTTDADWAKQWLGWVPATSSEISAYQSGKYISIPTGGTEPITRSQEYVAQFPYKAVTGTPITPQSITIQKQAQALTQFVPAQQPSPSDLQTLSQFQTAPNQYDLVKMAQVAVNDSAVKQVMYQTFDRSSIQYAEYAARPEFNLEGEGSEKWEKLSDEQKKHLRPVADATESEYAKMTDFQKLGVRNIVPDKAPPQSGWQKAKGGAILAAEILVPGVYAARKWNQMSGAEKGLVLAIDTICILPMTGAAVRGARAAYPQTTRVARLAGTAKGVGREAVAFVRAPVDLIVSPIKTIKGAGTGVKAYARNIESLMENVAHPSKIPEAVLTTSNGTVRLPLSRTTSTKEALNFQTKLMELANKGEKPVVLMGNMRVELARSPMMKEVGEGLAHGTPMGEAWEQGGKVKYIPGKPSREQGLFLSHEPLPRFTLVTAYGKKGEQPVIWILSKETAEKAIQAEKTYRSTVEMERRLKIGEVLYEPKQRLFTRIGPMQERVEIWLERPLSRAQIAKLKAQALVESVKTLAEPSIKISKVDRGLTDDKVRALAKVIEDGGDTELAERIRRTSRAIEQGRAAPPSLARLMGRDYYRVGERAYTQTGERTIPREVPRTPAREAPRTPGRETPREPTREAPREPGRTPPREPERTPPREPPPREPPRTPPREPPREPPVEPPPRTPPGREPPGEPPPRVPPARPPRGGLKLKIERVEGIPPNPGVISWDAGVVKVLVKPPYREGSEDIDYDRLKVARKGKGTQESTLKVTGGKAPQLIVLGRGIDRISVIKGKRMSHSRQRGPGIIDRQGRIHRQKRGSVI